jgi:RNA 2',3'-cyclic 3'-phosphodiesterase
VRAFLAVPVTLGSDRPARSRALEHLTLQFLGEVPEGLVGVLRDRLPAVLSGVPSFELVVEGVGAFPSVEHPRVVWRGVGIGREELEHLATEVRRVCATVGAPSDPTRFIPHLTLFRIRSAQDRSAARELLDGRTPPPPPARVPVNEVVLVESRLSSTGAEHRVVARFPLAERSS